MATNLENLKYSGIFLNMENSGKNCNKVFLVRHSNICVKQLFDLVNRIVRNRDEVVTCYIAGVDVE